MRRASVLRRALLSAPPSSVPAVRRATAPPRPFYSQTSGASGDQPPKSALEKVY
uniref:Uncharacterized protein n=1 Tax=Oryza brachyantha TaxID=4533 RepID=J3L9Y6_ORYBR